jgi:glycine C-acetyltransferase
MKNKDKASLNFHDLLTLSKTLSLKERTAFFYRFRRQLIAERQDLYLRTVLSAADREVNVLDPWSGKPRKMLMFGSNNYLGLAHHPYVRQKVRQVTETFGCGIGGPPLLNGYTALHRELEERLSALKHSEDTLIFSTGYAANLGLLMALCTPNDRVLYDERSHASFRDGLILARVPSEKFAHNDLAQLERLLQSGNSSKNGQTFVGVEGVYSMDGDLAPLPEIVALCRRYGALLMVDDAHGTGVLGEEGSGTAEHFGLSGEIDLTMGTFSKVFAVTGGFVSGDKALIHYLRFFARSYMFSASLPPTVVAAVLAGIELLQKEPWRRQKLRENVAYLTAGFNALGFALRPQAAIIALPVPQEMNIRRAAFEFHRLGIFVNSVEFPAVPLDRQCFRLSVMCDHTKDDLDRLLEAVDKVWRKYAPSSGSGRAPASLPAARTETL